MQAEIISENTTSYKFVSGEISSTVKVPTKLDKAFQSIAEKEGLIKYQIEKRNISTNGGNYLGELCEVDIKGKTTEGDKELHIFVKSVNPGEDNVTIMSMSGVYNTEIFVYKELSKLFNELQEEAHVPLHERYKTVKCFEESDTEAIIMENLTKKGFSTGYRMDVVSLTFADLAMRELAKFHALSFVIEKKRPEYFKKNIKTAKTPFIFNEDFTGFLENLVKITLDNIDGDLKERVLNFCGVDVAEKYKRKFEDETIQHCLCHGDYRPNNILSKITNGEAPEIIPVDYQLLFYGCPVFDLFYFIMGSTDQKFRRMHLDHFKDEYFETFTKFLAYFDIDVNSVYPRTLFEKEFREQMDYGLMASFILVPFILASENDVPDVFKDELAAISFQVDGKFKERIQGIVEDFIEWGVL